MKLINCHIYTFGNLKDFSYDFSDGLNTIKEENGWGKSTLAAFIKAIFYGLNGDNKKNLAENERHKYKPWNSTEKFGGSVVFEWKGKSYKLERFFGNKQSEDTVRIFDVETGKQFPNTENLGKRIFGIDEEGFLSTTYLSQKDFEVKSNTSITAKYNEVCEMQDADIFDKAVGYLEERAKSFKMRGDKGLIADAKREIFALGNRIERAGNAEENAKNLKADAELLEKELATLKKEDENLRALAAKAGAAEAIKIKRAQYEKALQTRAELLAEKRSAEVVLSGNDVSEEQLSVLKDSISELSSVREKKSRLLAEILSADNGVEEITPQIKKRFNPLLLIFVITGIIACAAGAIFSLLPVIIAGAALAVGGCIAWIVLSLKRGKNVVIPNDKGVEYVRHKREELSEYAAIEAEYEKRINEFFALFALSERDYFSAYSAIASAAEKVKNVSARLAVNDEELSSLEKEASNDNAEQADLNLEKINSELSTVGEWYKNKAMLLARKKAAITEYEKEADEITDLENKKNELTERIAEYEEQYRLTILTLKYFYSADENLKIKYRAPLKESLNKYLALISDKKINAEIDVDLKVTIEGDGSLRDTEYFSKGYKNLFEICKRFALTDVLFTTEKPFIILDDPFVNLDDKKLKAAIELLKKIQKEYQIIYFICHESRLA